MENKTFLIDFDATIDLAGSLQIEADTPELARALAKKFIKQCLEKEYCDIELKVDESIEDGLTVAIKETGHTRALNITNTMALN